MDTLDFFALSGLEWIYEKLEDRFGRAVAWVGTLVLALTLLGVGVAVLVAILR